MQFDHENHLMHIYIKWYSSKMNANCNSESFEKFFHLISMTYWTFLSMY
jgi:hypothetical protein